LPLCARKVERDEHEHVSPAHGLSEIGQIAITVGDVTKATAFYRDVLGLKFLFAAGPNLAFLAAGSVRIMLTTPQGAEAQGGIPFYISRSRTSQKHTRPSWREVR